MRQLKMPVSAPTFPNTKPAASDYVSDPFGPGKIYQKQPAVSCATCGIRPAALHYYLMKYVKISYYPIILIFPITILLSHQKKFLSWLCAKLFRRFSFFLHTGSGRI